MPSETLTYEPDDVPYRFTWDGGDYIEMHVPGREDPAAIIPTHGFGEAAPKFTKTAMRAGVDAWRENHC